MLASRITLPALPAWSRQESEVVALLEVINAPNRGPIGTLSATALLPYAAASATKCPGRVDGFGSSEQLADVLLPPEVALLDVSTGVAGTQIASAMAVLGIAELLGNQARLCLTGTLRTAPPHDLVEAEKPF